jgi:hypothetical protein
MYTCVNCCVCAIEYNGYIRSESCTVVSRAAECGAKLDTQITRINSSNQKTQKKASCG